MVKKQTMIVSNEKEWAIKHIVNLLRNSPFQVDFCVRKNPGFPKVVIEVRQEVMDELVGKAAK